MPEGSSIYDTARRQAVNHAPSNNALISTGLWSYSECRWPITSYLWREIHFVLWPRAGIGIRIVYTQDIVRGLIINLVCGATIFQVYIRAADQVY